MRMNIKTRLFSAMLTAGTLSVIAAESTVSENLAVEAGQIYEIEVAEGDTVTYSGVISGEGGVKKTGKGTLVLSGANTFSGGFNLADGKVRADNAAAFGMASVTSTAGRGSGAQIIFNVAGGTFANDFDMKGGFGASADYPLLRFNNDTVLNGAVTLDAETNIGSGNNSSLAVEFNGPLKGSNSIIYNTYGNTHFRSAINLYRLYVGQYDSASGMIHLYSPDNAITGPITLRKGSVVCHADNVLGGAPLSMRFGLLGTKGTFIDLNGFNQSIKYITSGADPNPSIEATGGKIKSAEPAALTITGMDAGATYTSYYGIDGKVSVVLDVDATSSQRFDCRTSDTTGSIEVKGGVFEITGTATFRNVPSVTVHENGTFIVNSTETSALQNLESLTVNGEFSVGEDAASPFGGNLNVELGENARLSLPAGTTMFVKSLSTNGVPVTGRITAGTIPQLLSGTVTVESALSENSWTGGGADDSVTLPLNWKNSDFVDMLGGMSATFASSDAVGFKARADEDVTFRHMTLSAADGFAFEGEGKISVGTGIAAVTGTGSAPVYSFRAPLCLGDTRLVAAGDYFPVSVAEGSTLMLEGDTEAPVDVKKTGTGVLDISGSNVWSGAFIVSDGDVNITGTITTPDGVDERTSVSGNGAGVLSFNMSSDTGASENRYLTVSNAVIEKPVWFAMGEASSTPYFNFPEGTTNIFRGFFCNADKANQRFRMIGRDTVVSLEGGGKFPWNFQITGLGVVYFRDKPFSNTGGKDGVAVQGNEYGSPTAVFAVAGNALENLTIRGEGGTIDMRVDNVLGSSSTLHMYGAHERTKQGSVLLLNGTRQTVGCLDATASVNAYSRIEGNGATLSIVNDSASSASACRFKFVGDVSLNFDSPGTLMLTNAVSSSSGKLEVERGTVTFAHDAAWTNVGEVAVSGTGRLVVNANGGVRTQPAFGRETTLSFADDGVLDLADGTFMRVKHLFVDGVKMPRGTYSYSRVSDENVRKHFAADSTGVVSVHGEGAFTVTIR